MSIAAPPEASRSITHFRCKKDFFYKIQYEVAEQRACIHSLYGRFPFVRTGRPDQSVSKRNGLFPEGFAENYLLRARYLEFD